MKIHITKQGETIEEVAGKYAVSHQDLIGINPHINLASDLVPGLKLKIPDVARTERTNDHIEKFYPHLDQGQPLNEQAVPIGLKSFPTAQPESTAASAHHTTDPKAHPTPEHPTPWNHLKAHPAPFSQEHPFHTSHPAMPPYDTRALIPPLPPYYPPYPYPYTYPPYGYGYPLPIPAFGIGHGWHGSGHGWHGGGHAGGAHHR